jgi:hypothetical protein
MGSFIQHVLRELKVIRGAPIAFFGAIAVLAVGIWLAMNWGYGRVIDNRDAEISYIRTQRDDYKDKLSGASPDQAAQRIAALEAKVKDIEPKPQRHLTDEQKAKLIAALKPMAADLKQIFVFAEAAREPTIFAMDFFNVFKQATLEPIGPFTSLPNYSTENGILVGLVDPDKPSDLATKYIELLRSADLQVSTTRGPGSNPKLDFDLFVCAY